MHPWTAGQEGPSPMEQETAPVERINKTSIFVAGVVNVRLFLKWLKEHTHTKNLSRFTTFVNTIDLKALESQLAKKGKLVTNYSLYT